MISTSFKTTHLTTMPAHTERFFLLCAALATSLRWLYFPGRYILPLTTSLSRFIAELFEKCRRGGTQDFSVQPLFMTAAIGCHGLHSQSFRGNQGQYCDQ